MRPTSDLSQMSFKTASERMLILDHRWVELLKEGSTRFGKELDIAPRMRGLLIEAGFVDVQEKIVKGSTPMTDLVVLRLSD